MAAVFGQEPTTYRCYYPTPRPSVEEPAPRTAPPPNRTTPAADKITAVSSAARSGAPSTGLHTPAQSKDLTREAAFTSEPTSCPSLEQTPTADRSSQVAIEVGRLLRVNACV